MKSKISRLTITAELLESEELEVVRESAEHVLDKVKKSKKGEDVFNFAETVWPAAVNAKLSSPELLLIPLSRLGAVQGFSGNRVMIGYFIDGSKQLLPSRPMVVKISSKNDAKKLRDEEKRANEVRLHLAYYPGEFALPLHCETISKFGILWSPFSSSTPLLRTFNRLSGSRLALGIEDLWFHLRASSSKTTCSAKCLPTGTKAVTAEDELMAPAKDASIKGENGVDLIGAIDHVFEILKSLHLRSGKAAIERRSITTEYVHYLRGVEGWGIAWHEIWAPPEKKNVKSGSVTYINPLWILSKISQMNPQKLFCGAVHGDLHPRNILFSSRKSPHVIDFGWAKDGAHIAKDFVLLECNVRFMVLRPEIAAADLHRLENWIDFGADAPIFANSYCQSRVQLIKRIRENAANIFPSETDWEIEYVIPLFLVALGLLKHLRDTDNQLAAMSFVVSMANHLEKSKIIRSV